MKTFNEEKVMSYIEQLKKGQEEKKYEQGLKTLQNSPTIKYAKLTKEIDKAKDMCTDAVLADLYTQSIPIDDDYKYAHIKDLEDEMRTFIQNKSGNKGSAWYVKEAIKKTHSPVLSDMMESVNKVVQQWYLEKTKNGIDSVSFNDLSFQTDNEQLKNIQKISGDLEFDELSDIIRSNVKRTIELETERAQKEQEAREQLENDLAQNMDIMDENDIQEAVAFHNFKTEKIYQPSLFEAIVNNKKKLYTDNTEIMQEAVKEFTIHNVMKALRLGNYSINDVKNLTNSYLEN